MSLPPEASSGLAPNLATEAGAPQYPAPWATKKPLEALRDTDQARIICLAPNVCLTPVGNQMVPVPYMIHDLVGHDETFTPSVRFTGQKAMVMRSHTQHCHGDEAGTGGGIKSGTHGGICEPIGHADQVRAEGSHVIGHQDRFWMNNRNTQGEAIFVRDIKSYEAPKDTDPVPGSLRRVGADQARADEGRVVSDASPEPLVANAQYADASNAVRTSAMPSPAAPAPAPSPAPSGEVIRPNVPQWNRPPPTMPEAPKVPGALRWLRFGPWAVGGAILLTPSPLAPPWSDEAPQDDFERQLFKKAGELEKQGVGRDEITEWFRNERRVNADRRRQETAPQPAPAPVPNINRRIDEEEKKRRCLVGPYGLIEGPCKASGGETHHIIPDMVYRLGGRPDTAAGQNSTADRIPNAPTLNQGMSICLTTGQHRTDEDGVHKILNPSLQALGAGFTPPGTAPLNDILEKSNEALDSVQGLDDDCKTFAKAAARGQVFGKGRQPGRTTQSYPSPDAKVVLGRGSY